MKFLYPILLQSLLILPFSISAQTGNSTPCPCCSEDHRAFDFWAGDWEVFKPDGTPAGSNHIIWLQDSCILQENWVSATKGYSGTSYNWFDKAENVWRQSWIDNQGGSLLLSGNPEGNKMVLSSRPLPDGKGGFVINRIIWANLPDGSVRQLWEVSADQGRTWTTAFDGLYKRKS